MKNTNRRHTTILMNVAIVATTLFLIMQLPAPYRVVISAVDGTTATADEKKSASLSPSPRSAEVRAKGWDKTYSPSEFLNTFSNRKDEDPSEIMRDYLWHELISQEPGVRPKIAVVLSGGGARGFSHIGVLRVLERNRLPVDIVVGTSIGAVIGALYASGVSLDKLEYLTSDLGWDKISDFSGASSVVELMMGERLLSSEKLEKYLDARLGAKNFYELNKKFACVAVDIVTGEKIVFTEGNVARAVRASATIPGVFEPVEYRHRLLVDGGLVENIPVDLARSMGADIVIALTARPDYTNNSVKGILRTLTQAIYIQGKILEDNSLKRADFVIAPVVKDVSAMDLGKASVCISAGVVEAESRMRDLKEFIIKKTLSERENASRIFLGH